MARVKPIARVTAQASLLPKRLQGKDPVVTMPTVICTGCEATLIDNGAKGDLNYVADLRTNGPIVCARCSYQGALCCMTRTGGAICDRCRLEQVNERTRSIEIVRKSTVEHVERLLHVRSYESTIAVADALGWDASGSDAHSKSTYRMVQDALNDVATFDGKQWRHNAKRTDKGPSVG